MPVWVRAVWLILVLDIAAFYIGSVLLGGDAAKLLHHDGKYYLSGYSRFTEVSPTVYYYSLIHLCTIGVAFVLAIMGAERVKSVKRENGLR